MQLLSCPLALSAFRCTQNCGKLKTQMARPSWELSFGKHPWKPAGLIREVPLGISIGSPLARSEVEDTPRKSCKLCNLLFIKLPTFIRTTPLLGSL